MPRATCWSRNGRPPANSILTAGILSDFLVEIEGGLEHAQLERSKYTAFRWVDLAELDLLKEQRLAGDNLLYQLVKRALQWGEDPQR